MFKKFMKLVLPVLAIAVLFCACRDKASDNAGDTSASGEKAPVASGDRISMYDEGGLSFDIPEAWQQNFKAVTREAGSSGNTYPQTDFYYTEGERDIRLMSIGKYTREQWENLKKTTKDAENAMLGESPDKKHVYSVYYENHDYIEDKGLKDILTGIRQKAEEMRDKIKIK
ncbi:MAG: hypothetical protein IJ299_02970 [Oscillospiraceae bacterium]|nr:hypothetical protein [Oscillospiraceae bacterium]